MMRLRPTTAFGSAALALVLACAACGSSSPDVATVRQQFQAIVTSTNKALTKDRSVKHPDASFAKYSVTFHQAADQFRAITFPASMEKNAKALVTALDTLSVDAAKVAKAAKKDQKVQKNVLAMAKLNLTLMEEEKTEQTASNALRRALDLPEETTTTHPPPPTTAPPTATSTVPNATTTTA